MFCGGYKMLRFDQRDGFRTRKTHRIVNTALIHDCFKADIGFFMKRARVLTAELTRLRAERVDQERADRGSAR